MRELKWKNLLCVKRSLTESIIQQKIPWLQHFTLRLNTQETVNMRWGHAGSCRNVNKAHCHQRIHNKEEEEEEALASHASGAVGESMEKARMTGVDTLCHLSPQRTWMKGWWLCPAFIEKLSCGNDTVFSVSLLVSNHHPDASCYKNYAGKILTKDKSVSLIMSVHL